MHCNQSDGKFGWFGLSSSGIRAWHTQKKRQPPYGEEWPVSLTVLAETLVHPESPLLIKRVDVDTQLQIIANQQGGTAWVYWFHLSCISEGTHLSLDQWNTPMRWSDWPTKPRSSLWVASVLPVTFQEGMWLVFQVCLYILKGFTESGAGVGTLS